MAISECSGHNEQWAEEKRWKGHVLVVPWPAQGHINPMMHLSSHLAAHSMLVTFVNAQFTHDRILQSRAGLRKADMISEGNIRVVGIADGLGYDEDVTNFSIPKQVRALKNLEPVLMKLVEDSQPPVTCIIADLLLSSTLAVARQFNIPHVSFWPQSATSYAAYVFFTQNHASLKEYLKKLCDEGNVDERVIECVPGCPAMSYKELPASLVPCDPAKFFFSSIITTFQTAPHSMLVLLNTFEELEQESLAYIHTANMLCMGPILPSQFILNDNTSPCGKSMTLGTSFWVEDEEGCLPWLHQQNPNSVLYISFGSITRMSISQVLEFASGLEASGWPFLMVVRPKMMQNGDDVVFPNGFVDRMRGSGRAVFVAWAPQLEILAHPSVGGFLTHAGWNSTLESICRGVPMLCWPYFGDQMLNARCIVDAWKIGLDFVAEKVTKYKDSKCCRENEESGSDDENIKVTPVLVNRKEIERKIRQLMDPLQSTEIRKRIKSLRKGARMAYESSPLSTWKVLLDVLSR